MVKALEDVTGVVGASGFVAGRLVALEPTAEEEGEMEEAITLPPSKAEGERQEQGKVGSRKESARRGGQGE